MDALKIGENVYGRLKNGPWFQGKVVEIRENDIKVIVERCMSVVKIGKKYNVDKKNIKKISNINYKKLSNCDVRLIAGCLDYKELEYKAVLNEASMPIDLEPTKEEKDSYNKKAQIFIKELKEKIQEDKQLL